MTLEEIRKTIDSIDPQILGMIGDYGCNLCRMEQVSEDPEAKTVTFDLTISGDLHRVRMKKLMFQLSKESEDFRVTECL